MTRCSLRFCMFMNAVCRSTASNRPPSVAQGSALAQKETQQGSPTPHSTSRDRVATPRQCRCMAPSTCGSAGAGGAISKACCHASVNQEAWRPAPLVCSICRRLTASRPFSCASPLKLFPPFPAVLRRVLLLMYSIWGPGGAPHRPRTPSSPPPPLPRVPGERSPDAGPAARGVENPSLAHARLSQGRCLGTVSAGARCPYAHCGLFYRSSHVVLKSSQAPRWRAAAVPGRVFRMPGLGRGGRCTCIAFEDRAVCWAQRRSPAEEACRGRRSYLLHPEGCTT